jgi:hypothetical protein
MPYEIRRLTIDTSSWTAVTPPIDCTSVDIEQTDGTNAFKVSTDSAGVNWKNVPYGIAHIIEAGSQHPMGISFPTGKPVCYVQAAVGTGPVAVEFTW